MEDAYHRNTSQLFMNTKKDTTGHMGATVWQECPLAHHTDVLEISSEDTNDYSDVFIYSVQTRRPERMSQY